ncbi:pentatricopeptide repeat-containing protein, partial [Trifolium medium]|nr:pentatricopeptide repeat-containing protein [Trifolium medium]
MCIPHQILEGKPALPEMKDIWDKKVELSDFIELDLVGWIARIESLGVKTQENLDAYWDSFSTAMIRRFSY